jgi:hypothetical protein
MIFPTSAIKYKGRADCDRDTSKKQNVCFDFGNIEPSSTASRKIDGFFFNIEVMNN